MLNSQTFTAWAQEAGFAETGFCLPDQFSLSRKVVQSQEQLRERKQLRFAPLDDFPETKSIAVLLWPYCPAAPASADHVFVDSYYAASNAAYHAAKMLEARVLDSGCFAKANVAYPAKEAALRAQLGIIGRNALLITPEYGSRVVIILMATGIEIHMPPEAACKTACRECSRCTHACPMGALDETGMAHPEKCLRNYMMEGTVVPEAVRFKMGNRIIGCDICQRVCPMQPHMERCESSKYALHEFVTDDPDAFSQAASKLAEEIGRNAARPQRIRAQAALLAGNSKDERYLPTLRKWAQLPFEAVSEHARWAIRQIEQEDAGT